MRFIFECAFSGNKIQLFKEDIELILVLLMQWYLVMSAVTPSPLSLHLLPSVFNVGKHFIHII